MIIRILLLLIRERLSNFQQVPRVGSRAPLVTETLNSWCQTLVPDGQVPNRDKWDNAPKAGVHAKLSALYA